MIEVNYDPSPGGPDGPPPGSEPGRTSLAERLVAGAAFAVTILLGLLVAVIVFGLGALLLVVVYQELISRLG